MPSQWPVRCSPPLTFHASASSAQNCHTTFVSAVQVRERLRSDSWEGRTAAGDCLGLIAAHCQHNTAADVQAATERPSANGPAPDAWAPSAEEETGRLSLVGFSIDSVLQHGTQLLASGGTVSRATLSAHCSCVGCSGLVATSRGNLQEGSSAHAVRSACPAIGTGV